MPTNQRSQSETRAMEERARVPGMLELPILEEHCRSEIEHGCLADPTNARFSCALLHRAISRDNQEAREAWQRCFGEVLRSWLHRHPRSGEACRLGSEEGYLAQTFACFWQTIANWPLHARTSLPTVLRCLQACLQGVLLDALRSQERPKGILLGEPANSEGQAGENHPGAHQWWERIQDMFPDVREQRMAYLLFHCHLSPSEIFCATPQQFRDVQEICHLRTRILEQILQHADLTALLSHPAKVPEFHELM